MAQRIFEDLHIDGLSHEGRGLATQDGKRQFVLGALPGERVNAYLLKKHKQYNELCVTDVHEASSARVDARCPHFLTCGGCRLQHMSAEDQLAHKRWRLAEHLDKMGHCQPEAWASSIEGPHWHYRRKARLSVRYVRKKERLLVGFRELDGRKVAIMEGCSVLHPKIVACLQPVSELIAKSDQKESIPQLEWVVGSDQTCCIVRHLKPMSAQDHALWHAFALMHDVAVYLQAAGLDSIVALQAGTPLPHYALPDFDLSMQFHPSYFIQVNDVVNQKLIARAIEWLALQAEDRVCDFFCGLGNFSLPIATQGATVLGLEGAQPLVEQARINAQAHHLEARCQFLVEDLQVEHLAENWCHGQFNKVVLDPPRTGAAACMPLLERMRPERIVYVSCHSATLARDAGTLQQMGYRLKQVCVADMFPQTEHVEAMALFDLT